jgi:GMP synthase-like glutamine amidotransferase
MDLRIHWFQHVPFEGLGSLESWARSRNATVSATRWHAGDGPPPLDTFDWLVVMGGPMGVYDEEKYPWLAAEKRCLRTALDAGKTVVGICLGAQLIACVLGAQVSRNPEREVGWFPVRRVPGASDHPLAQALPDEFEAFHWHGDTFALPCGARSLARSEGCENQAFAIGNRVLGLQFHLETTPESVAALIARCPGDLAPGRFVQGAGDLVAQPRRFQRLNALMAGLMDRLAQVT